MTMPVPSTEPSALEADTDRAKLESAIAELEAQKVRTAQAESQVEAQRHYIASLEEVNRELTAGIAEVKKASTQFRKLSKNQRVRLRAELRNAYDNAAALEKELDDLKAMVANTDGNRAGEDRLRAMLVKSQAAAKKARLELKKTKAMLVNAQEDYTSIAQTSRICKRKCMKLIDERNLLEQYCEAAKAEVKSAKKRLARAETLALSVGEQVRRSLFDVGNTIRALCRQTEEAENGEGAAAEGGAE